MHDKRLQPLTSPSLTGLSLTLASVTVVTVLAPLVSPAAQAQMAASQSSTGSGQGRQQPITDLQAGSGASDQLSPSPESVPFLPLPAPSSPPAALAQPFDSYRLGPGDVISVYVRRFSDLDFQATIDPEGQIAHPLLGKLSLQGLSLAQAQVVVQQALDRFVIHPVVSLSLATPRPAQVTVVGEVARPGLYPLQSQAPKISAVLLAAGGTQEGADLRQVRVRRHLPNGRVMEEQLDLFTPLQQGQALPDLRLQDGDTIVIPKLTPEQAQGYDRSIVARSTLVKPKITVRVLTYARGGLGQVVLDNGSTFVDALASSGVSAVQSNLNQIALVRFDSQQKKAVTLELDGKRALLGDASQNVPLQDNDVIIVGRNLVGKITYTLGTLTQPFRDVLGFTSFFNRFGSSAWNLFDPGR